MVRSNLMRTGRLGALSDSSPDELIAYFTEAIQTDPHDAEAYYGRGIAYMKRAHYQRRQDLNNAIADFSQAIRLGLNEPDVFLRRGVTYQASGETDRAVGDFAQAIGITPRELDAYLVQTHDYERNGRIDEAEPEDTSAEQPSADSTRTPLQKPEGYRPEDVFARSGDSQRLDAILSSFKGEESELIPILLTAQAEFGCLTDEIMYSIARFTGVPESRVYAVATFYSHLHFAPVGTTSVVVCRGVSCYVCGASRILSAVERELGIRQGETTTDQRYSLSTIGCTGSCARAPCIMIDDTVESRMTPQKVAVLFRKSVQS